MDGSQTDLNGLKREISSPAAVLSDFREILRARKGVARRLDFSNFPPPSIDLQAETKQGRVLVRATATIRVHRL